MAAPRATRGMAAQAKSPPPPDPAAAAVAAVSFVSCAKCSISLRRLFFSVWAFWLRASSVSAPCSPSQPPTDLDRNMWPRSWFSAEPGSFLVSIKELVTFSYCPTPVSSYRRKPGSTAQPDLDFRRDDDVADREVSNQNISSQASSASLRRRRRGGGDRRELGFEVGRRPGGSGGFFVSPVRLQDSEIGVERAHDLQPDWQTVGKSAEVPRAQS